MEPVDPMPESARGSKKRALRGRIRRGAEEALRASEARRSAIVESALDCVITIDHQGRVLEFNPAAERTFGYAEEEVLGKEIADLIVPPALREGHRRALEAWEHPPADGVGKLLGQRLELPAMRADGSEFPVELAIVRLDLPGPPVFTASVRDISERKQAEEQLRQAEARYRALIEQLPLITYVDASATPEAPPLYLSPQVETILGYSREEWLSRPGIYARSVHPDDRTRVLTERARAYAEDKPMRCEYRMLTSDGRLVWILDICVLAQPPDGGADFRQGFMLDITDRKVSEHALAEAEAKYRTLVEHLPLVVYVDRLGSDGSGIYVSPQIEAMLGEAPETWTQRGLPFASLVHPGDRERILAAQGRARERREPLAIEYRLQPSDGRVVWVRDEAIVVDAAEGAFLQGYLLDITDRKHAEEQLRHQAFHDGLTGLANRALFAERMHHAVARRTGGEVAVLFLDVDDFKTVNDSLGHACGDELLRGIGERICAEFRPADTVARFGGDEFAILLEDVHSAPQAARAADRLARALGTPILVGGRELFVTASMGIALGQDPAEVLRAADVAMYRAKASGKGGFAFYNSSMDRDVRDRLDLLADLRRALPVDELLLHYQPTVDLSDGRIVGAEALLRWRHPLRGLLPPAAFIALAEETGLIVEIGQWVLAEACRQAASWRHLASGGSPLLMSINVSAKQLQHPAFPADVAAALVASGLPSSALVLEITESVLVESGDKAVMTLVELQKLGVGLALDDFGTGFSSLGYLQDLPVGMLKIDRSFVEQVDAKGDRPKLVGAIVDLAQALGLVVVAEGIERASQVRELRRAGCLLGQGFHFGLPAEAAAFEELFLKNQGSARGLRVA